MDEQNKIEELDKVKHQSEEYLNNWKRERADFINYKKDEGKRMEEFVRYANEDLITEIIEVMDDLDIALKHIKDEGIKHVSQKFRQLLQKYGVEQIAVEGQAFDPNNHEVVQAEGDPSGKLEEIRAGYILHGKVIRPARVKILKNN